MGRKKSAEAIVSCWPAKSPIQVVFLPLIPIEKYKREPLIKIIFTSGEFGILSEYGSFSIG